MIFLNKWEITYICVFSLIKVIIGCLEEFRSHPHSHAFLFSMPVYVRDITVTYMFPYFLTKLKSYPILRYSFFLAFVPY